ncbi:hypothetical protein GCM10009557_41710 [Virgisporangium ochraceum]|uniref:Uncharacterized protein n=1 Tax=Virgisporangium ochraceum TaxID=65505 RepID=A0A8J4EGA9_9ACTN|nr:hypothetical protein Voc01_058640 [Virgisporangium ochraceum]
MVAFVPSDSVDPVTGLRGRWVVVRSLGSGSTRGLGGTAESGRSRPAPMRVTLPFGPWPQPLPDGSALLTTAPGAGVGAAGGDRAAPAGAATLALKLAWPTTAGRTAPQESVTRVGLPARGPPDRPG